MSQLRVLSSRSAGLKILHRPIRANRTTSGGAASMSVSRYQLQKDTQLVIQKGDITEWEGDAVVNAANERMLGGGGVDGAIHRAAGPGLLEACKRYPKVLSERCPTGDAKVTLAYEMPCKWIIHTVGPIFKMKKANECREELRSAYIASLAVANGIGASTIAFPAISCGVYGYPLENACYEAIKACYQNSGDLKEVHFVLFGSDTLDVWLAQANKSLKSVADSTEESTSSHASSAKDESSPMDATPYATAGKDSSSAVERAAEAPAAEGGTSSTKTTLQDILASLGEPSTLGGLPAPEQASESKATAGRATQGNVGTEQGESVQTLTGVKEGKASEAPLEAIRAPEVLEAAPPASDANLPGHSGSPDASQKGKDIAVGADMGRVKDTPQQ